MPRQDPTDPPVAQFSESGSVASFKTWPPFFDAVISGRKTAEFRREDRHRFEVGQVITLLEQHPDSEATGRCIDVRITDVRRDTIIGIPEGYAMLSIRPLVVDGYYGGVMPMDIATAINNWQHEPCWYAVRAGAKAHWIGDRKQSTIWQIAQTTDDHRSDLGAQKPVECMRRPIANHRGDVYDPFLGSGTTLVAAEQLGRVCYGMEIEPRYVDVVRQRYADFVGDQQWAP